MNQIPSIYHQCLVPADLTVKQALERINSLRDVPLTLFVIGDNDRMLGTLTDGDIRRGLIAGATLGARVAEVMQRSFRAVTPQADPEAVIEQARALGISLIPELNAEGCLTDIIDLRRRRAMLPLDAVLMAGGRGERLKPLTLTTPKPLLPVGDKAIIDHNVDSLAACGVNNIFVTVNYLHEMLEEHFATRRPEGVEVTCVLEPRPLGTFGSIGLIRGLRSQDVLVMNSDLLTDLRFEQMYRRHIDSGADMTIAAVPYTVSVPYAILETRDGLCTSLQEKPTYNYLANAGVYIVKRTLLETLTGEDRVDATDFIDTLLATPGAKVVTFPIEGTWIDIGSPSDYHAACERMR